MNLVNVSEYFEDQTKIGCNIIRHPILGCKVLVFNPIKSCNKSKFTLFTNYNNNYIGNFNLACTEKQN